MFEKGAWGRMVDFYKTENLMFLIFLCFSFFLFLVSPFSPHISSTLVLPAPFSSLSYSYIHCQCHLHLKFFLFMLCIVYFFNRCRSYIKICTFGEPAGWTRTSTDSDGTYSHVLSKTCGYLEQLRGYVGEEWAAGSSSVSSLIFNVSCVLCMNVIFK